MLVIIQSFHNLVISEIMSINPTLINLYFNITKKNKMNAIKKVITIILLFSKLNFPVYNFDLNASNKYDNNENIRAKNIDSITKFNFYFLPL